MIPSSPHSPRRSAQARGGSTALPEPTEAELEELYQAVDFHPEEQQAAAAAVSRAGAGPAVSLSLSLDCLVSKASLLLVDAAPATPPPPPDAAAVGGQDAAALPSSAGASSGRGDSSGGGIACLELDQLSLQLQVAPKGLTASLKLAEVSLHDLCSEGQGVSSPMLLRGTPSSVSAGATVGTPPGGRGHARSPVLRLQLAAPTAEAQAAGPGHPGPRPQVDVLVQPLLLRLRPLCLARLLALVPPVLPCSFHGCQLASLNGLAPEARCAIKARQVAALGPPVNLLVKVGAGGAGTLWGRV